MLNLKRMTTEYVQTEDRFRIAAESECSQVLTLWLTMRLLQRLLPHLLAWVEKQTLVDTGFTVGDSQAKNMLQVFAQQSAQVELSRQAKKSRNVSTGDAAEQEKLNKVITQPDSPSVLVLSVDINRAKTAIKMVFKGTQEEQSQVVLSGEQLRQWLAIIQSQWLRAGWPKQVWPHWMLESSSPGTVKSNQATH